MRKVAFYKRKFFGHGHILRTLQAVRVRVDLRVFAQELGSDPYPGMLVCPKGLIEKAVRRISSRVRGHAGYDPLSDRQSRFFSSRFEKWEPDLIHACYGPSGLEIAPVAARLALPLVVHFHGYDASSLLGNDLYQERLQSLLPKVGVIAVSSKMHDRLVELGASPERSWHIPYCVEAERFPFVARTSPAEKLASGQRIEFLQAATLITKKGHRLTLKTFDRLRHEYANVRLTLVGDGPLEPHLRKLCAERSLDSHVRFVGRVLPEKVKDYLAEADVFLHHSITAVSGDEEGTPNAVLEAMSTGLPVVVSDHAGLADVVDDGVTGFLCRESDADHYLEKLRASIHATRDIGFAAARHMREEHNPRRHAQQIMEAYEGTIRSTRSPS